MGVAWVMIWPGPGGVIGGRVTASAGACAAVRHLPPGVVSLGDRAGDGQLAIGFRSTSLA
jgi:hypothetical protein